MGRYNHHDAHLPAVIHCIGNDRQGRLCLLQHYAKSKDEAIASLARNGFRRLLLGKEEYLLNIDGENDDKLIPETDELLESTFVELLERQLPSYGK